MRALRRCVRCEATLRTAQRVVQLREQEASVSNRCAPCERLRQYRRANAYHECQECGSTGVVDVSLDSEYGSWFVATVPDDGYVWISTHDVDWDGWAEDVNERRHEDALDRGGEDVPADITPDDLRHSARVDFVACPACGATREDLDVRWA